jgi:Domain of unknown function (DUF1917)
MQDQEWTSEDNIMSKGIINLSQNVSQPPPRPRRETSLRPGLGGRIYWNGTDDVPLQEWIERIRPSRYRKNMCEWIQVTNINQNSSGYCQDDDDDDDDDDNCPDLKSLLDQCQVPLNEITKIIQNGGRVSSMAKDKCITEIMRLAKENNEAVGKWLIYVSPDKADDVWETIARSTALGKLGCSSKVAPTGTKHRHGPPTVICVYVNDSTNKVEVQRVLKTLYYDLGIAHDGLSNFKPDIFTYLGIYKNNPWRLNPTLYDWKDALAWNLKGEEL